MFGRRKIAAIVAEFLGTATLTLLFLNVKNSTIGVPFFVAAALGVGMVAMTFAAYRVSGAQFNPALTLALFTARQITLVRTVLYIAAQLAGGFLAGLLYVYITKANLQDLTGKFDARVLVAEGLGAFLLAFGYTAALYQRFAVGAVAAAAGLAYFVGSIVAQPTSLGILNPAVALGTKAFIVKIFVLGPVVGALLGVQLYKLLFASPLGAVDGLSGGAASNDLSVLQTKAGKNTEVTQTTVTTVKTARKPRAVAAKSGSAKTGTVKRAPRKR